MEVRVLSPAPMIILGIETSCDETALALIETRGDFGTDSFECRIIQSLVHSQAGLHSAYGGVYPSLAKREHSKNLVPLLEKVLKDFTTTKIIDPEKFAALITKLQYEFGPQNPELLQAISGAEFIKNIPQIDLIAVTEGPGLEPALWVGITFARILSEIWNIPVTPINHMEGHVIGSLIQNDKAYGTWQKLHKLPLPSLALLISGGHTELVRIESSPSSENRNGILSYTIVGETKDDAVGEAFDKVARLLGLPYPGGPHISKLAHEAREKNISTSIKLPRPMIKSGDGMFSFSGLKTAVLYAIRKVDESGQLNDTFKAGLAREFEDAVTETLDAKLRYALEMKKDAQPQSIIVGGGVSANTYLRNRLEKTAQEYNIPIFLPSLQISGDNALMIALAATLHHLPNKQTQAKQPPNLKAHGTKRL